MDKILLLNKLQYLGLSNNKIANNLPQLNMSNLQCLMLTNNLLSDIQNISLSNIPNITFIKLSFNPF
jgi:Leucine-rich repeat (LRR) protein